MRLVGQSVTRLSAGRARGAWPELGASYEVGSAPPPPSLHPFAPPQPIPPPPQLRNLARLCAVFTQRGPGHVSGPGNRACCRGGGSGLRGRGGGSGLRPWQWLGAAGPRLGAAAMAVALAACGLLRIREHPASLRRPALRRSQFFAHAANDDSRAFKKRV